MMDDKISMWDELGKNWPKLIFLKDIKRLENFPYAGGYVRNLCTGSKSDPELIKHVVRIGKFPAVPKPGMIDWLKGRTG